MNGNRAYVLFAASIVAVVVLVVGASLTVPGCHRSSVPASTSQPVVTVPAAASQDGIYVYFSPRGGASEAVVEQINQAHQTLEIEAYQFTSAPIAKAVLEAQKRGVQITVILDKSQEGNSGPAQASDGTHYSSAQFFRNQNIPVYIDGRHKIFHNKVMLIDGRTIITGSFNFTKAAQEDNAENLWIIQSKPDLYAACERNFRMHLKHAVAFEGQEGREQAPSRSQRSRTSRQPASTR